MSGTKRFLVQLFFSFGGENSGFCKLAKQSVKGGSSQKAALSQSCSHRPFSRSWSKECLCASMAEWFRVDGWQRCLVLRHALFEWNECLQHQLSGMLTGAV